MSKHQAFMELALELAREAAANDEVPVGCVITYEDEVIGQGRNHREAKKSALAHAEMIAIEAANQSLGAWRLNNCDLYVTLEPCIMCAGAIYQARIARVFYAAKDPKGGAMGSLYNVHCDHRLNHQASVTAGLCQDVASELLRGFFLARR